MQDFVHRLLTKGEVELLSADVASDSEINVAIESAIEIETQQRSELPHSPPDIERDSLRWSFQSFYAACQLQSYRNLDEDEMARRLRPFPDQHTQASPIATHYSVDLFMRFLPDLFVMVQNSMPDDPLSKVLLNWAGQWPLSSVGIPVECDPTPILTHPCTRQMYLDRIIRRSDENRLQHAKTRQAAESALGAVRLDEILKTSVR